MTRLHAVAVGLIVVLGATVGSSLPVSAHADTIELVCRFDGSPSSNERFVSIDTSASTVASGYTTYDRNNVSAAPATITSDQVTWAEPVNPKIVYLLDRTTGTLTQAGQPGSWTCTRASKVF